MHGSITNFFQSSKNLENFTSCVHFYIRLILTKRKLIAMFSFRFSQILTWIIVFSVMRSTCGQILVLIHQALLELSALKMFIFRAFERYHNSIHVIPTLLAYAFSVHCVWFLTFYNLTEDSFYNSVNSKYRS